MSTEQRVIPVDARSRIVPPEEWQWFGHAAHFICGRWCRFHMATKVGDYLVSTVGEYWPERPSREIHAKVHDASWLAANKHLRGDEFDFAYMKRFGFQEIGYERLYETMVFAAGAVCTAKDCGCGLPTINGSELDFIGSSNAKDAAEGHRRLCSKWADPAQRSEPDDATPGETSFSTPVPVLGRRSD